jgi:hypothetical protein
VLPGRWWLALTEERFKEGDVLGAILLCRTSDAMLDFALPAARLRPLLPHLSLEPKRGERKLNVQRIGSRYVLRVPGRQALDLDLTDARGDLSWLARDRASGPSRVPDSPTHSSRVATTHARAEDRQSAPAPVTVAFFAKVRKGALEPLDDPGLEDGAMVLVTAALADSVPASSAMRRIVARGGPASLPADLAERHDVYARSSSRS